MSYATVEDMRAAFPARDLIQLTQDDPTVEDINAARLQSCLDESSALIDTFLEGRFALPLPVGADQVPAVLRKVCRDLAMYALQSLRPIHDLEDAHNRYKAAIAILKEIRDGRQTLGLTLAGAEPVVASPTVLTQPASGTFSAVFSRETLRVW